VAEDLTLDEHVEAGGQYVGGNSQPLLKIAEMVYPICGACDDENAPRVSNQIEYPYDRTVAVFD